jgi:hypothetical protein
MNVEENASDRQGHASSSSTKIHDALVCRRCIVATETKIGIEELVVVTASMFLFVYHGVSNCFCTGIRQLLPYQ